LQAVAQQFRNERTRHDDALIHVKPVFTQPRLARQVGRGNTLGNAALKQAQSLFMCRWWNRLIESCCQFFECAAQRMHSQPCCFVIRIQGAVTVSQFGTAETLRGSGNQLPGCALLRKCERGARHLKYQ